MTDLIVALALASFLLPIAAGLAIQLAPVARLSGRVAAAAAGGTAACALALSALALDRAEPTKVLKLGVVDKPGAIFLAAIAVVGLMSVWLSPSYLVTTGRGFFPAERARSWYYLMLFLFWAALLAVPLAANLTSAWLLVEATTGASALLVAFNGKRSALEAGWKYLVLTTIGLTVALLGIVVLVAAARGRAGGLALADWSELGERTAAIPHGPALTAFVLILVGLAAKIGWAPVHNWLPDAHSEAPPPVSALLSAALLPAVVLVAWRVKTALLPAIGAPAARHVFIGFGLASLAIAVPFLWRPLAWKRLLAYSSLEHMGVLALGIGFGSKLALAGVALHVLGHALAKSLGFYAATPLLQLQPAAARHSPRGLARTSPTLGGAVGVSLLTLSGLPPSPLFVSELFILLGGALSGQTAVVAVAAVLLALAFLGLAHAFVESLVGRPRLHREHAAATRPLAVAAAAVTAGLVALSSTAYLLPGSTLVAELWRWSS
ncbi:MAG TPA: proton-conducting transporter membrane subunit [Gaiellaceae bacterium]|nr:proton-conducting transporter membrane subunit [Gaiellaceae bacterium]